MNEIQQIISDMLKEQICKSMLDSGGHYGYHCDRNKEINFLNTNPIYFYDDFEPDDDELPLYTVSVFHYLTNILELDDVCREFNKKQNKRSWKHNNYGLIEYDDIFNDKCETLNKFFKKHQLIRANIGGNTYNNENSLSQDFQFEGLYNCDDNGDYSEGYYDYVLLQIHGGCDIRSGYTKLKMFKLINSDYPIEGCPFVFAQIGFSKYVEDNFPYRFNPNQLTLPNIEDDNTYSSYDDIVVGSMYYGYCLSTENGERTIDKLSILSREYIIDELTQSAYISTP